jgi:hypothetical protein
MGAVLRELLERWDRSNQAKLSGEIPESMIQRWRWNRTLDSDGQEQVSFGCVTLNQFGLQSSTRSWAWERIAYLTWEMARGQKFAVFLHGDPYIRDVYLGLGPMTQLVLHGGFQGAACRALLRDCREFVEEHGSRVYATLDGSPSMWWVNQPESRRT